MQNGNPRPYHPPRPAQRPAGAGRAPAPHPLRHRGPLLRHRLPLRSGPRARHRPPGGAHALQGLAALPQRPAHLRDHRRRGRHSQRRHGQRADRLLRQGRQPPRRPGLRPPLGHGAGPPLRAGRAAEGEAGGAGGAGPGPGRSGGVGAPDALRAAVAGAAPRVGDRRHAPARSTPRPGRACRPTSAGATARPTPSWSSPGTPTPPPWRRRRRPPASPPRAPRRPPGSPPAPPTASPS